jgi:predicted transcriptional regulator
MSGPSLVGPAQATAAAVALRFTGISIGRRSRRRRRLPSWRARASKALERAPSGAPSRWSRSSPSRSPAGATSQRLVDCPCARYPSIVASFTKFLKTREFMDDASLSEETESSRTGSHGEAPLSESAEADTAAHLGLRVRSPLDVVRDEGSVDLVELRAKTNLPESVLMEQIGKLTAAGVLAWSKTEENATVVILTPSGQRVLDQIDRTLTAASPESAAPNLRTE